MPGATHSGSGPDHSILIGCKSSSWSRRRAPELLGGYRTIGWHSSMFALWLSQVNQLKSRFVAVSGRRKSSFLGLGEISVFYFLDSRPVDDYHMSSGRLGKISTCTC